MRGFARFFGNNTSVPVARLATTAPAWLTPLLAGAVSLGTVGCIDEPQVTMPAKSNELRLRSVKVDLGKAVTTAGGQVELSDAEKVAAYTAVCISGANCSAFARPQTDGVKVSSLRGVNGAPLAAVPADQNGSLKDGWGALNTYWARIPMGYGCDAMLQGIVPDGSADLQNISNYKLTKLDAILGSVVGAIAAPVWTAGYELGTAGQTCTYNSVGQVQGKPIADPVRWAKAVRRIANWYDRELPNLKTNDPKLADPACKTAKAPWYCNPTITNIEFGRDWFGAGGYTPATKTQWLELYKQFALEMRQEFPVPGNDVNLIGPSVVIEGAASVAQTTPGQTRHVIYDFIDYVVDNKLPLSMLSFELESPTPSDARLAVQRISDYAKQKGLKREKGLFGATGTEPIGVWVMDLRLTSLPAAVVKQLTEGDPNYSPARASAWRGGQYMASKILWQGLVQEAVVGSSIRYPTKLLAADGSNALEVAQTAKDSDFLWFGKTQTAKDSSLKPAAWQSLWFSPAYLGDKQVVAVQHGPDPLAVSGAAASDVDRGIVVLATRSACVDFAGEPMDCIGEGAKPLIEEGRKHIARILITDFDLNLSASTGKEILEHNLRIEIAGLPKTLKTVGFRWWTMDGGTSTYTGVFSTDKGLLNVTEGTAALQINVSVPSMHYLDILF
jgi:hypothetical protein